MYGAKKEIARCVNVIGSGGTDQAGFTESVQVGFPGWEVKFWSEGELGELERHSVCREILSLEGLHPVIRNHIRRYEIMRLAGGALVSPSLEFLQPLENIMIVDCLHLSIIRGRVLSNSLIVSPAGFGFWDFLLHRIRAAVIREPMNEREIGWWTGPYALGESIRMWLNDNWLSQDLIDGDGVDVAKLYEHGDLVVWNQSAVFAKNGQIPDAEGNIPETAGITGRYCADSQLYYSPAVALGAEK